MRFYAGIGSRRTPPGVLNRFVRLARFLGLHGFVLRSGGAPGADQAFEAGCGANLPKEIYLPWQGFEGRYSSFDSPCRTAYAHAAYHHPAWINLSRGARALQARNTYQVLGATFCDHSEFVVCWTPGGRGGGGTGQAIRIAEYHDIPVFDFGCSDGADRLAAYLRESLNRQSAL